MNGRKMCLRGLLLVPVTALALLGLLLLGSSIKADAPPFPVYYSVDVSDPKAPGANSDIVGIFGVLDDPWPAAMYEAQISFIPVEWGVPEFADIPIGAVVGEMDVQATVGWFNDPCISPLNFAFQPMYNCTTNPYHTVDYDGQFVIGVDGLPEGCTRYPEFLNTMFPGMVPRTRHAAFENVSGALLSLNFMTIEPGTDIPDSAAPGVPPFGPELGYVAMSVLGDPTAPPVPNLIAERCSPLGAETTYYGLTRDNPNTAADESGYAWRTNPSMAGTYVFNGYTHSIGDADGDDIDNDMDSCPHIANGGDPRVKGSGDNDEDGIDNSCDPLPNESTAPNPVCGMSRGDHDGDCYPNRQDNCPLVQNGRNPVTGALIGPNDQLDSDFDRIGDACDVDDWNGDGDTIDDPGEPTGFSPSVYDGDKAVAWFAIDIEIGGPPPTVTPTPTPIPTITPTVTPTVTPLPTITPTVTPTVTPLPTITPTVTPTVTPIPTPSPGVGGIVEMQVSGSGSVVDSASSSGGSSLRYYIALAGLAGAALVAITAGGWYARTRRVG
jgi:hypothetical protein